MFLFLLCVEPIVARCLAAIDARVPAPRIGRRDERGLTRRGGVVLDVGHVKLCSRREEKQILMYDFPFSLFLP